MYSTGVNAERSSKRLGERRPHLEIAGGVEQQVGGLQVAVQDVGGVDVLEPSEDLVEEVADVVVAQVLSLQELVEVRLHEILDDVSAQRPAEELGFVLVTRFNAIRLCPSQ